MQIGLNKQIGIYLHIACCIICFLISAPAFSQDTITPVRKPETPTHIAYGRETDIENLNPQEDVFDSSLSTFHRARGFLYDFTDERNIFQQEVFLRKRVVNFSDDITLPYKFSENTIKYYRLNKRFSEITYLLGAKKEQLLNIVYAQNLWKGWTAGIDFTRAGGNGFFKRQVFYQSSFDVFTHYESKNKRYNLHSYYLRNRLEQEENGGINEFDPAENTVAQPTYLSSAQNNQTDKEFLLMQSFQFRKQLVDSLPVPKNIFTVGHKLRYETRGNAYFDSPTDSFYKVNYFSDASTSDTTWYQRWNNELVLGYRIDTSALAVSVSGGHEYFIYKYGSPHPGLIFGEKENFYGSATVHWGTRRNYLDGKMYMYFGDYNGDYDASVSYNILLLKDEWKFFVSAGSSVSHPNITDRRRYSNHFIWVNDFDQAKVQSAEAGIASANKKIILSGFYSRLQDLIYYDSTAAPKQFQGTIGYYRLKLQKNFFWRQWIFENTIEYQKADNEDIIHLPPFMTGHSLCFEKNIFKNALFGRVGMDVRYVSPYFADRYMPAIQEFYLQHDKETGGYVFADFFVTFRVKSARFFVKMENVFNGIYPEPKFYRPDYPLNPRYVRFGFQLRFFD